MVAIGYYIPMTQGAEGLKTGLRGLLSEKMLAHLSKIMHTGKSGKLCRS